MGGAGGGGRGGWEEWGGGGGRWGGRGEGGGGGVGGGQGIRDEGRLGDERTVPPSSPPVNNVIYLCLHVTVALYCCCICHIFVYGVVRDHMLFQGFDLKT